MDYKLFYSVKPLDAATKQFLEQFSTHAQSTPAIINSGVQRTNAEGRLSILWGAHMPTPRQLDLVVPAGTYVVHYLPRGFGDSGFNPLVWSMRWQDTVGSCTLKAFVQAVFELQISPPH